MTASRALPMAPDRAVSDRDDENRDDCQHDGVLRHRLPALIREAREEILDLVHGDCTSFLHTRSFRRGAFCGDTQNIGAERAARRPPGWGKSTDRPPSGDPPPVREPRPVDCAAMENLIDGKAVAALVRAEVGERVRALQARTGVQRGLATVMVGDDPGLGRLRRQQAPRLPRGRHGLVRHPPARGRRPGRACTRRSTRSAPTR